MSVEFNMEIDPQDLLSPFVIPPLDSSTITTFELYTPEPEPFLPAEEQVTSEGKWSTLLASTQTDLSWDDVLLFELDPDTSLDARIAAADVTNLNATVIHTEIDTVQEQQEHGPLSLGLSGILTPPYSDDEDLPGLLPPLNEHDAWSIDETMLEGEIGIFDEVSGEGEPASLDTFDSLGWSL